RYDLGKGFSDEILSLFAHQGAKSGIHIGHKMRFSLHLNDREGSTLDDRGGATLETGPRSCFGSHAFRCHKSSTIRDFGRGAAMLPQFWPSAPARPLLSGRSGSAGLWSIGHTLSGAGR